MKRLYLTLFTLALMPACISSTGGGEGEGGGVALSPVPSAVVTTDPNFSPRPSPTLIPEKLVKIASTPERLQVPKVGIDLPIRAGDGDAPIAEGVAWHLEGTAPVGQGGNAFFYSHARSGSFATLWDVQLGDFVKVVFANGTVTTYVVSQIVPLALATEVRWLQRTDEERLTLQTSTGSAAELPKFIVIARRVE